MPGVNDLAQTNSAQIAASGLINGQAYNAKVDGAVDGVANQPIRIVATESLFNPFNVFRYSKFAKAVAGPGGGTGNPGNINLDPYKLKYERSTVNLENFTSSERLRRDDVGASHNPSAVNLVEWANKNANDAKNSAGPLYPYPYSITDFLWCKYYGKIPNNRLITLRRYPVPVEDNLMIAKENLPLVPLAQAVTWFGVDTGNKLSEVLKLDWGFPWTPKTAEVKDVEGNEVQVAALLDAAGIPKENENLRKALIATLGNSQNNGLAASGMDKNLQDYDRETYKDNGPYWNRVLGPVNMINTTQMRSAGLDFGKTSKTITLNFEYNLRTWSGANPKVAFLDLLSNFLSLTYSSAPFWGGSVRYFQQTGFLAPGFNTDNIEKGNNVQGAIDVISGTGAQFIGAAKDLKAWVDSLGDKLSASASLEDITKALTSSAEDSKLGQMFVGSRLSSVIQKPLVMRALLDGRAVGEWHMMIGNPMEPIAVVGNLCLNSCTLVFGDELGEDGFPTSMKFTVVLEHGRPRAKQDIESMFNLGGGPLSASMLAQPSSASNTFGESNSLRMNSYYGLPVSTQEIKAAATDPAGTATSSTTTTDSQAYKTDQLKDRDTESTNLSNYFKPAVERAYGSNFANSNILPTYFYNRVTKD
jgi:hypothetical protein